MNRYKIIVNPVSGRGAGEHTAPLVEQMLSGHGLGVDLVHTERPWHAAELAQQAAMSGYEVVVAVGGDGTANEVLNGLMLAKEAGVEDRVAMGALCVGQGNDFAFGVGIPLDLAAGCRALAQDQRRTIDVGRVVGGRYPQGRYFGNGIGIGFDAAVSFEAARITWLHGFASYFVAVLKTIFLYYQSPLIRIEYDEQTITQPSMMVSVMNGRRLGGGFLVAPQAKVDDGLFELLIADRVSRARIFALIPHFLRGTQATQKPIKTTQAQHVVVTAIEGVLPAHGDGEVIGVEAQQLSLELLPRQIEIICDPQVDAL